MATFTVSGLAGVGETEIEVNIPANPCIKTIYVSGDGTNLRYVQITFLSDISPFYYRLYTSQNDEEAADNENFVLSFDYPICIGNSNALVNASFNIDQLDGGTLSVVYIPNCCNNTPQ